MGKLATFLRFVAQQRRERGRLLGELDVTQSPLDLTAAVAAAEIMLEAGDRDWRSSGVAVRAGQSFTVDARGTVWMSRALAVGLEPRVALWVRIGGTAPIRKLLDNRTTFTAWADGAVELRLKSVEWADEAGEPLEASEMKLAGAVTATVAAWNDARPEDRQDAPGGWRHLWRLGEGRIYAAGDGEISVATHGDAGILQLDCDAS